MAAHGWFGCHRDAAGATAEGEVPGVVLEGIEDDGDADARDDLVLPLVPEAQLPQRRGRGRPRTPGPGDHRRQGGDHKRRWGVRWLRRAHFAGPSAHCLVATLSPLFGGEPVMKPIGRPQGPEGLHTGLRFFAAKDSSPTLRPPSGGSPTNEERCVRILAITNPPPPPPNLRGIPGPARGHLGRGVAPLLPHGIHRDAGPPASLIPEEAALPPSPLPLWSKSPKVSWVRKLPKDR